MDSYVFTVSSLCVLTISLIKVSVLGRCSSNKFGPGCPYDCHCKPEVTCDPVSGCPGNCDDGWDGRTCQRQNVALNRPASQSPSISPASNAVDGKLAQNYYSCASTSTAERISSQSVWNVTLDQEYNIHRFIIYLRTDCCRERINGFTVSVGETSKSNNNYRLCYKDNTTSSSGPDPIIQIQCSSPLRGDVVMIRTQKTTPLTLCEVIIHVCAAGWWGEDCGEPCGHCYNNSLCSEVNGHCPVIGRKPRCMAGYKNAMCLTNCTSGTYGPDCNSPCGVCAKGVSSCNIVSGNCPVYNQTTCYSGYRGIRCDLVCSDGTWGPDCKNTCGQCWRNMVCNKSTGVCPVTNNTPRCSAGYRTKNCSVGCESGRWGEDCTDNCRVNCVNQQCDGTTGVCFDCMSGYEGDTCDTEVTQPSSSSPLNAGVIGGSVGAVVVLVVVVVIAVVLFRRRHSRKPRNTRTGDLRSTESTHTQRTAKATTEKNSVDHNGVDEESLDVRVDPQTVRNVDAYENADQASDTFVSTDEFWEHVLSMKEQNGFEVDFKKLPAGLQDKHETAEKPENKAKSRYRALVAYDHSRVVLSRDRNDPNSDYINASYIDGHGVKKKYIASQGPTKVMIKDFMRMIWEQDVGKVVMVTNLFEGTKMKSMQYWPDEDKDFVLFGEIQVKLLHTDSFANFTVRTLQLKYASKVKEVKQFHYTAWPDHGVPPLATGILDFRDKVNSYNSRLKGPILVHCSAGIGRSGTYIALDILIEEANREGWVNVLECVKSLRKQRVNMVQSLDQYEFLHEALAEAIKLSSSFIPCVDFSRVYSDLCKVDPATGQSKLHDQFQILSELTPQQDKSALAVALHPENKQKNRSTNILAADTCRPFLSTPVPEGNNYINAVFLPGYRMKRAYIVTQMPLENTVIDFWRLIYEQHVRTIVMLDPEDKLKPTDGIYWPKEADTFGPFGIAVSDVHDKGDFSECNLQLTYGNTSVQHPIKQFRCKFWSGEITPESPNSLLAMSERVGEWQRSNESEPIVVHCRDGATKGGLYCAASSIFERLKVDKEVNILQTVKQMRVNRPQIITSVDQLNFLYQVVGTYLETFQTYANFSEGT